MKENDNKYILTRNRKRKLENMKMLNNKEHIILSEYYQYYNLSFINSTIALSILSPPTLTELA